MGILDRLFGKEKPSIRFEEIDSWLSNKERKTTEESLDKISSLLKNLEYHKHLASDNLTPLIKAELMNKKIPDREKQIMEGNRTAYIQKVALFLDRIKLPDPVEFKTTISFTETYKKELELFTTGSQRAYYMLSEFFSNEAGRIARDIKEMDIQIQKVTDELSNLSGAIEPISEVRELLKDLTKETTKQKEIANEQKETLSRLKQITLHQRKIEEELITLERSVKYRQLKKLQENLSLKKGEQREVEQELYEDFSVLDRALRKYSKLSIDEEALSKYLEDPVKALIEDIPLQIVEILGNVRHSILAGGIGLKDKKQEKTIKVIDNMTKSHFEEIRKHHARLVAEIDTLQEQLSSDPTYLKHQELLASNQQSDAESQLLESRSAELSTDLARIDLQKTRQQLINRIGSLFEIKIV